MSAHFFKWGRGVADVVTEFSEDKRLRQGSRAPRSFAILRVGKIKTKGHLGAALGHNFRERDTPNADLDRRPAPCKTPTTSPVPRQGRRGFAGRSEQISVFASNRR